MDDTALEALILQAWKARPDLVESLTELLEALIAERDEARAVAREYFWPWWHEWSREVHAQTFVRELAASPWLGDPPE